MRKRGKKLIKTAVSLVVAIGLAFVTTLGVAAADTGDGFPVKYDLRDDGLVTPVKFQNPWGTCWAFGGIAAIESSLLSYMGMTNDEYKAKNNGKDFDLSEKHVAWFGLHPVTKDINENQVGEGVYPLEETDDQSGYYNLGGETILIGTLLASGVGPLLEETFPYKGKEGFTELDYYTKHPEETLKMVENSLGKSMDEYYEYLTEKKLLNKQLDIFKSGGFISKDEKVEDFTLADMKKAFQANALKSVREGNCFSAHDDWSIDEKNKDGISNRNLTAGFVLSDANVLPALGEKDKNGKWKGINEEGMIAVKQELLEGRGVCIGFRSDHALPGQPIDKSYLNTETWAHYTFEDVESSHAVCIVGWDDTYSRNNFVKAHRPPGDGAWIVKNSWGSETDYQLNEKGEKIGYNAWGVTDENGKHTGYFYLSYYDKSIEQPESIEFSANIGANSDKMYSLAYDYMPSKGIPATVQDNKVIKTSNVFLNDSGEDLDMVSFSTKTGSPNAQVVYDVYKLKDGAKSPEDGEYLGRRRAFYPYAGFHREDMMKSITIKDGESFSVVTTETVVNESGKRVYEYVINNGYTKKGAIAEDNQSYCVGIVNKGESYLYKNNEWFDWSDVMTEEIMDVLTEDKTADDVTIDNFSIKAYLVPSGDNTGK